MSSFIFSCYDYIGICISKKEEEVAPICNKFAKGQHTGDDEAVQIC